MSKPDKAQITYLVGEGEQAKESVIRFHSVIAEEHEVTNTITKFSVQTGFNISNHSIRNNRRVTITGVVTNHLIVGAEEFHEYGGNNVKVMFSTLKDLVRQAKPCDVLTNYGSYSPVVFTKFKTRLKDGLTDSMEFTMVGEEVQVSTSINGTTPTLLVFTPLAAEAREARVDELERAGLEVPEDAVISEAPVDFTESFQVETKGTNGKPSTTTYERLPSGTDKNKHEFTVHTDNTDVVEEEPTTNVNWFALLQEEAASALPDVDLVAGMATTSACLVDGAIGLGNELATDYVNTSAGRLKKSIYGAAYGVFGVNGNRSMGQVLLSLGVDCLVAGAVGSVNPELNADNFQDNSIPTLESTLAGAAGIGNGLLTSTLSVTAPSTLTKIESANTSGSNLFFGDLI